MEKGSAPPYYNELNQDGLNNFQTQYSYPTASGDHQPVSSAGYPPQHLYSEAYSQAPTGYGGAPPPAYTQYTQAGQYPPQGYPAQPYQYGNVVVSQPLTYQSQHTTAPPDHMCAAIFVTLCCFWPTGIVAIMRASDARSALARGDLNAAHNNAKSAKSMVTLSVIIGIIAFVLLAVIIGVYVGVILKNLNDIDYYD